MKNLATNKDLWASINGIPQEARTKMLRLRNRFPLAGTDRAVFRRQIPHNPMRILQVAKEISESAGWRDVRYGIDSSSAWLSESNSESCKSISVTVRDDIDRDEAESIACLHVLQEISSSR